MQGEPDMPAAKISQRSGLRSRCHVLSLARKNLPRFRSIQVCQGLTGPFCVLVPNMPLVSADEVDRMRRREFLALLGGAVVTSRLRGDAMATFEELAASGWCRSCARQGPLIYNACPALTM